MLVSTLKLETQDDQLFSKEYPLLAYACETAFHTIRCSALNAEELRREGGLDILQEALNRCVNVLGKSSKPENVAVQVSMHIVRCFTGAATFPACRERLVELPNICKDISRILYFDHLTKLCLCTVECVSAFASDLQLQKQLFKSGALYSLLLFLFKYDFTLEEGGVEANEETNQQEVSNQLAKMSIIALSRLAGDLTSEEKIKRKEQSEPLTIETNNTIRSCLNVLLTPYLARKFGSENLANLLKELTSNVENPYLIWDNSTRVELIEYLTGQLQSRLRGTQASEEALYSTNFVYSAHKDELVIGEIFVRIYNQQPMFQLFNAKEFTTALLDYTGSQAQYLHSQLVLSGTATNHSNDQSAKAKAQLSAERLKNMEMSLQALCNVIKYNSGVETVCIGHFKLLFSLLKLEQLTQLQLMAINVISSVSNNQDCVADIAASEVLVYLLLVLQPLSNLTNGTAGKRQSSTEADLISFEQEQKPANKRMDAKSRGDFVNKQSAVLDTLLPLMANNKLVKEVLGKGAVVYLLDLFCYSTSAYVREKSAELLSKMSNDKLVGPKVRILFSKFLPLLFLDAMSDSPEAAVNLFDGQQENPELIWNNASRETVSKTVRKMAVDLFNEQHSNPASQFKLDDEFRVVNHELSKEITVSGVYLRLFVQNPSWVLRRPKEFLTDLMDNFQTLLTSKKKETDVSSFCN